MQLNKLTHKTLKGFTLIELLVVIAIIGLLVTIVAAPVNSARKKAVDTKKIAEIKGFQNALENYANDNGQYPTDLSVLVPQYTPALSSYLATTSSSRDHMMYVSYAGLAVGAQSTTTYGYHVGVSLGVFNPVLAGDNDCWGVISSTSLTTPIPNPNNGNACAVFVVGTINASTTANPYLGQVNKPVVAFGGTAGVPGNVGPYGGITGTSTMSLQQQFIVYNYVAFPYIASSTSDFQGMGNAETSTTSCAQVQDCIYDRAEAY